MFDTSRLVTTNGAPVRIIDPGKLSHRSGPDFRDAKIEIGGILYSGDIEFHRHINDWELHHHQDDLNYNSVILHVSLQGDPHPTLTESGRTVPTVVLEPFLRSPIAAISDHLSREEYSVRHSAIPCAPYNDSVKPDALNDLMQKLYRERLQEKIRRMHERLDHIIIEMQRTVGEPHASYLPGPDDLPALERTVHKDDYQNTVAWEQLLYEEVMDCLGYSNNRAPMKALAERVPLRQIGMLLESIRPTRPNAEIASAAHIESILFKASGLLPNIEDVTDTDSKVYLHSLNAAWKELNAPVPSLAAPIHPTEWNFSPTRPGNFPTIRIAAAGMLAFAILRRSLFRSILTIVEGRYSSAREKTTQLTALLNAGDHPFWNYHYSFEEASHKKHSVLGAGRINDILVNAVIPYIALYAAVFTHDHLMEQCLNIVKELPLLEDNAILRTMRSQLIKGKLPLSYAVQQQGLIQTYKRYCTAGRCSECRIGRDIFQT